MLFIYKLIYLAALPGSGQGRSGSTELHSGRGSRPSAAHAGRTAEEERQAAHLFFASEQKATGQHLLVARTVSGLHTLRLNLTFYKGVETETSSISQHCYKITQQ